jgi:hypothetical protein
MKAYKGRRDIVLLILNFSTGLVLKIMEVI